MMTLTSPTLRKGLIGLTMAAAAASLAACAEDYGPRPYRYSPYETGMVSHVDRGVIVSFRPIEFGPGDTSGGALIGGVAGGVVGNAASHGRDRGLATAAGAVAGALIGNAVAKDAQRHPGFAYTIQLDHGGRIIEVPQADASPIPNGVRVNVVYEGGRARVVPAGGYAPPPPERDGYAPPPPPPPPSHY